MVCAMQELNTTAVAITEPQQHHHHHHYQPTTALQHSLHQQQMSQQVEIVRALPTQFGSSNSSQAPPQMTTIVVLTTPTNVTGPQQQTVINVQQQTIPQQQPQLQHQLQQQHQQQQQQQSQQAQQLLCGNNKSQQLKKQHASLVRLLESAPITKKSLKVNKTQNTSPHLQQQQQIVIPQLQQQKQQQQQHHQQPQQQIIYVQQQTTQPLTLTQQQPQLAQQLAQPKRLKINSSLSLTSSSSTSALPPTTAASTPLSLTNNSTNPPLKQTQHQQVAQLQPPATDTLGTATSLLASSTALSTSSSMSLSLSLSSSPSSSSPSSANSNSDKSNIIKTLNTSTNHNLISTIATTKTLASNQECQKPQEHQLPLQQQQLHLKNGNETGMDEESEELQQLRIQQKETISSNDSAYEPQQCPWKKIRFARELKQKEQMQKQQEFKEELATNMNCDNDRNSKQSNSNYTNNTTAACNMHRTNANSSNSFSSSSTLSSPLSLNASNTNYELNLAEQTHKEIAILLQQQHQNYQQQQQQQQQHQHQHRRDSSDSNSSLISNSSSTHSLSNGCTCTPQQLQAQRDSSDDDLYLEETPLQRPNSRRSSLIQEEGDRVLMMSCQCNDCHLEIMDDSGCDDDQKEEEQTTLNYLCQKFDENLETGKQSNTNLNSTDLDKVAIVKTEEKCKENEDGKHQQKGKQHKDDGFFRRSIQQKIQYRPCTKNQQCSILRINRNRCQYCRLKKCIAVGMSRDAVRFGRVPKREKARILAAMQQSTQNRGQQRALSGELDDQPRLLSAVLRAHLETCEFTKEKVAAMRQRARECPSYSMPTLLACPLNPAPELQSEQEFSQRFAHVIRGVIDFAGMIPGFQLLSQDDKFTLLKAGLFDALFVRLICMFDNSINSIICLNGQVMRRDAIQNGANARFLVDSTFNFAERMNSMNLTDAEIGLFCAIVLITPDRPGLRNIELIEKMYSRLKGCLQTIINQNRPDQPDFMSKLLETMPDLRTLSTLHTEKLVVFRTEHKELLRQQMRSMEDEQPTLSMSPHDWEDHRMDVEAKSPLGSVSSTESNDLEYQTAPTTTTNSAPTAPTTSHHLQQHLAQQTSSLASSAPLLAATLSGSCPLRNRANSGSSGDSTNELDMVVGSHAHLTQNGLTITPIVRAHSHQQLQHHLTAANATHRYRKLDSPTDSGIESGNEKNECSKNVSSGGSSSCSSPRSSVDDALDCQVEAGQHASTSQVTVSVSPVRSPQPLAQQASSTSNATNPSANLKRQIVDDMPVLKRVLQAPPLYDTNSLMDEAYKPHKKFRALRHREYDCMEADASSSTNTPNSSIPAAASSPLQQNNNAQSPPPSQLIAANASNASAQNPVILVPQATHSPQAPLAASPPAIAQHQSQLHMHLTRPTPTNSNSGAQHQPSSLSSTHSVLAKSLMAEPRMTPEQMKRSDIIQNYIMRDSQPNSSTGASLMICSPHGAGSRSPAPLHHQMQMHSMYNNGSNSPNSSTSPNSPSTTTSINNALASPPSGAANSTSTPASARWPGHSVITTTSINQRQQSVSPSSNGSSSSSSTSSTSSSASSSSASSSGCQYFQSPHSTSASVSPPRPSPTQMPTPPRLLELQVDIADSQQPLNLSKKSPTPPPSKLQALVAAATAAQRYPTVSADVTVTATSTNNGTSNTNNSNNNASSTSANNATNMQQQKVMLEA